MEGLARWWALLGIFIHGGRCRRADRTTAAWRSSCTNQRVPANGRRGPTYDFFPSHSVPPVTLSSPCLRRFSYVLRCSRRPPCPIPRSFTRLRCLFVSLVSSSCSTFLFRFFLSVCGAVIWRCRSFLRRRRPDCERTRN